MAHPEPKWDKTLEKEVLKDVLDVCKEMLVVDPKKRNTAAKFEKKVAKMKL